jgi:hypothetical protein
VAYALLVESYQSTGMGLYPEAIGAADDILYGPLSEEELNVVSPETIPTPADNDAALAQLEAMMHGVARK